MPRSWLVVIWFGGILAPLNADAQHHQHHNPRANGPSGGPLPALVHPTFAYPGFYGSGPHRHHVSYLGAPYVFATYLTPPPVAAYPVSYMPTIMPMVFNPVPPVAAHSTAAARLKSLDLQARGDQKMREQKWSEARAAYAGAVSAASDRAEAHLRLGVCFATIQRFDWAIREFKRALVLDPKSGVSGKSLKDLFGPDSQGVRTSVISKLEEWVHEDMHNSDRMFLLGAMLHFDGDVRGREMLEAALKLKTAADVNHIAVFLNPNVNAGKGQIPPLGEVIPALNERAVPILVARPFADLRFPKSSPPLPMPDAPVPMPDGPIPMP